MFNVRSVHSVSNCCCIKCQQSLKSLQNPHKRRSSPSRLCIFSFSLAASSLSSCEKARDFSCSRFTSSLLLDKLDTLPSNDTTFSCKKGKCSDSKNFLTRISANLNAYS